MFSLPAVSGGPLGLAVCLAHRWELPPGVFPCSPFCAWVWKLFLPPTCFQMRGGSDEPFAPPRELHHYFSQLCPEALYEALKTLPPAAPQSRRTEALERDSGEGAAGPWTPTSPGI